MQLLLVDEVAKTLRVPKARIYELVRQGELPAVRVGRLIRISGEALQAWIAGGGVPLREPKEAHAAR